MVFFFHELFLDSANLVLTNWLLSDVVDVDGVIHDPHLLAVVGAEAGATAEAIVTGMLNILYVS